MDVQRLIARAMAARDAVLNERIQRLWSGYGDISRWQLTGGRECTVVAKHINAPSRAPRRGPGSDTLSHERKVRSYEVERAWYEHHAQGCDEQCRVPRCFGVFSEGQEHLLILEDLDRSGYPVRVHRPSWTQMAAGLDWLAAFHARFMGNSPQGLWPQGTYWHLKTRPQELRQLQDVPLKRAAGLIDRLLESTPYKTLLHGDAKLANFCFNEGGDAVAAVDFQYVGGGAGVKDVAYFVGSCLDESELESWTPELLDHYFSRLEMHMGHDSDITFGDVASSWRALYPAAWVDFHRFFKGWSPGTRFSSESYSERITRDLIAGLEK